MAETEGLIGLFVNSLVLRCDLAADPPFTALLDQVREVTLGAYAHQDLPFERLVASLAPERDLSRSPLFQVLLVLQNTPGVSLEVADLAIAPLELDAGAAKLDLSVSISEWGGGLAVSYFYNRDLFDAATIERWAGHFRQLLGEVVAAPERRLSEHALLTPAEVAEIAAWNRTAHPLGTGVDVLERLAVHVAETPDRVAVACDGRLKTYGQLDARASALAARLGAAGIVALLAERSPEFLAAVLGVFRAGGAYLPLDPQHPAGRIARVLGESRPQVVLCGAPLVALGREAVAGLTGEAPELLALESLLAPAPAAPPGPRLDPESLAYVLFTSGSTGVPKGAMVVHRGMVNHLAAKVVELALEDQDIVAQTASQCFDISVWQFLAPLMVGGRVEIYGDAITRDPALLLDRVDRDGVTILETVPSLLRIMLASLSLRGEARPGFARLRWLIPTGEALPPDLAAEWYRGFPRVELLNAYGPTECSDDVSHYRVPAEGAAEAATVPIGRPVINTGLYVLDRRLRLLPRGVPGELAVGGLGVGRGYLGKPGRTAEVFVPDPSPGAEGARLYRTGDLARLANDGNLEFLGRIDHQVKIRGFRIELGEIEAALLAHPAVREAVVVKLAAEGAGRGGEARLAAYVVAQGGVEPATLKEHLGRELPDYMVPTWIVFLEAMPLSANGKVDRRALPAPEAVETAPKERFQPPRTPAEVWLAELWAKVLPSGPIAADTHFFEAGGSSLAGAVFINDLQERLGQIVHVVPRCWRISPPTSKPSTRTAWRACSASSRRRPNGRRAGGSTPRRSSGSLPCWRGRWSAGDRPASATLRPSSSSRRRARARRSCA
jgi:amino acid adenylation domain-containing protein